MHAPSPKLQSLRLLHTALPCSSKSSGVVAGAQGCNTGMEWLST
jgi:hypothetical protein